MIGFARIFKLMTVAMALSVASLTAIAQETLVSKLEVYDVESNEHVVIREFDYRIEAPNWSKDGKYLIYNSNGKIYRLPVDSPLSAPEEIKIDGVSGCNNDHVLSADGKFLAVSGSRSEKDWASRVFVLPLAGGRATEVTPLGPSYLHGVNSDMTRFAYCAFRDVDKDADVYVCGIDGRETRLTDAPGLDDGPEFSPCDKYIWFNSVRTGLMQVWRMKDDGSEQTQMTFDEDLNSWFPHVSPDGKQVVYICYHKGDLAPGDHLPNKNVLLRMISAQGGAPRTLVELFGGQGTINVNSWSPDSRRFAYVSYEIVKQTPKERRRGRRR